MSKRAQATHETRSARQRRQTLLKAGIWIFLAIFVFSIVGVAIVAYR
ncbi:MAG: hypothetical protein M3Z14_04255 [Candidatus Eremiobacteraeota bacterium]|nr:hypothetical protein [Candidatus Eremiobacteraeota bacterium]